MKDRNWRRVGRIGATCAKAFCVHFYKDVKQQLNSRRLLAIEDQPLIREAFAKPRAVSVRSMSDRRRLAWNCSRALIPVSVAGGGSERASDTRHQPYRLATVRIAARSGTRASSLQSRRRGRWPGDDHSAGLQSLAGLAVLRFVPKPSRREQSGPSREVKY
jgi:hypothetical protein